MQFMESNGYSYEWREGQFCIMDNTVTWHSRQPFSGQRRVMTKDCKKVNQSDPSDGFYQQTQLVLTGGQRIPSVGLGCWRLSKSSTQEIVYKGIKSGYRMVDGRSDCFNEVEVGRGIRQAIQEQIVTRAELFISSQLWNTYYSN